MTDRPLAGRVSLVTGAASGLGEATTHALARAGAAVAALDVSAQRLEAVGDALTAADQECLALPCDVADAAGVASAVQATVARFGRVDILVNCAAIDHTLSVHEMSVAQWDQVMGVNLRGPFLLAKACWPVMERQHAGHIINIASTAATRAWANASAYHASKWGLIGFGRGLGVEGRPHGIRVTTILPGGMRTHFFDRFVEQGIPMPEEQNLQAPETVAALIVFAASLPPESVLQEALLTPLTETSWP